MAYSTIMLGGFELTVHDFEPSEKFPESCAICSQHPTDLPHWTAG